MEHIYDMIIVGGGPGGYTAALYGARAGLDTLTIERQGPGGQMTQTMQIDNYPGFGQGIDGVSLGDQMRQGAERFGARSVFSRVSALDLEGKVKRVDTDDGPFFGRTVVISTGADHRALGLPRERELVGRGVSYCAACDGMFYRNRTVVVIGGGNSAVADALTLSRIAREVILIHRRDTLRASKVYHAQLEQADNIRILWNSRVTELVGEEVVEAVRVETRDAGVQMIPTDGVFISIGRTPATDLVREALTLDREGYILADETTCTSVEGVYAVGDVRSKAVRQIVTATADGAVAVHFAQEYLAART